MARTTALSRERIVTAAVEMLDAAGPDALTFRALNARLQTGFGAIYHHVANKDELLIAATDRVLTDAVPADAPGASPEDRIRATALSVFDAIDRHAWVAAQLARAATQPAVLRFFERIGQHVQAMGVPGPAQFGAASALLFHILGAAAQNAALARSVDASGDRRDFLTALATSFDPDGYPFLHAVSAELSEHDDRAQFLTGIDLILAGIVADRAM
ncbi:TetR/AcrR family transcriptional regulator [Actinoplanes sp. N902-109]|uniref:TetR/AcrR family transcriptional regulator n=1 Tax=Actinoplanes sp. (strain N902-109) TaxID=649831 RepID=UPI00032965C1|nr:TetR/AcrR family transcriptional regulator C-terminal domain-containing protein [Actinoplanes sp. N902-109]AGL14818.1 transcriptional regulator, TetR family [Actinoplanes sp. N902-109]